VVAPSDAELVYKASLKLFPPDAEKLCVASKSSFLKLVVNVDVIAII
jgi:hypothetical protein